MERVFLYIIQAQKGNKKPPGNDIFSTRAFALSIVCAEAFHFRVREGNGWYHLASITRRLIINLFCILLLRKESKSAKVLSRLLIQ